MNFADEIDELVTPGESFGEIHYQAEGKTWVITPSFALGEMVEACKHALNDMGNGQRIIDTVRRIGPLLDTCLLGFAIPEAKAASA